MFLPDDIRRLIFAFLPVWSPFDGSLFDGTWRDVPEYDTLGVYGHVPMVSADLPMW